MFQRILRFLNLFGLLLSCAASSANAGLITVNVDLAGADIFSGNTLRVFGTLTVDPDMPISAVGITSALNLQRKLESPIPLPSIPRVAGPASESLAWYFFDNMLFINRTSSDDAFIVWETYGRSTEVGFKFGSGGNSHSAKLIDAFPHNIVFDLVYLKHDGPVDGPFGFLVGNVVPEPTSTSMLVVFGAVSTLLRFRRRSVVAIHTIDWHA